MAGNRRGDWPVPMTGRLRCHVAVASGDGFPEDDAHPFWTEIETLGEKIAASLKTRGVEADTISRRTGNGSHLTVSSDTPAGSFYFWIELPSEPGIRAHWLSLCLDHLTRARNALPDAGWDLSIEGRRIAWHQGEFREVR